MKTSRKQEHDWRRDAHGSDEELDGSRPNERGGEDHESSDESSDQPRGADEAHEQEHGRADEADEADTALDGTVDVVADPEDEFLEVDHDYVEVVEDGAHECELENRELDHEKQRAEHDLGNNQYSAEGEHEQVRDGADQYIGDADSRDEQRGESGGERGHDERKTEHEQRRVGDERMDEQQSAHGEEEQRVGDAVDACLDDGERLDEQLGDGSDESRCESDETESERDGDEEDRWDGQQSAKQEAGVEAEAEADTSAAVERGHNGAAGGGAEECVRPRHSCDEQRGYSAHERSDDDDEAQDEHRGAEHEQVRVKRSAKTGDKVFDGAANKQIDDDDRRDEQLEDSADTRGNRKHELEESKRSAKEEHGRAEHGTCGEREQLPDATGDRVADGQDRGVDLDDQADAGSSGVEMEVHEERRAGEERERLERRVHGEHEEDEEDASEVHG
ncbi:hypothetical protein PINS_up000148 [Pythium insidiosum]|nr:hypothetical protein PINS_up000148 [Pythium insidiosum]